MAGKVRYLHYKRGRYSARLVVPADLRRFMGGKTELTKALGADRRQALRDLPGAVALLQHEIAQAERHTAQAGSRAVQPGRYPLDPGQLAASLYAQRLAADDALRNDARWPGIGIDDLHVAKLRDAMAGRLPDAELHELVGSQIERFRASGNLTAAPGSDEWRTIARALAVGEYEALARMMERDEGDFAGRAEHPLIVGAEPVPDETQRVSIKRLWTDYIAGRQQIGSMRDGGKRQQAVIDSFLKHLRHEDAARVTRKDVLDWREKLMAEKSAKTVSDIYLSTIRSLFAWAVENERLKVNVAATVKQPKPRRVRAREAGYTDAEAVAVLIAARTYEPNADETGRIRETPEAVRSKRWVPILTAFSGARVSEITQLRKQDVRKEGNAWVMRITPDAGTVKAGGYRDVPLHPQIIAEGFLTFLEGQGDGPLFHSATDPARYAAAAQRRSNKLANWLRDSGLTPEGLQPNHAWRHRFKTQARTLGVGDRIADALQGHAPRTASDNYGDVTLDARIAAINRLPSYKLT